MSVVDREADENSLFSGEMPLSLLDLSRQKVYNNLLIRSKQN